MATGAEVLSMLLPEGGWVIYGNDFDSIIYDDGVNPVSKKDFENGFPIVDAWLASKEAEKNAKKAELLSKLGITEEEAKLLLS